MRALFEMIWIMVAINIICLVGIFYLIYDRIKNFFTELFYKIMCIK